ncbi:MAG TPA: NlpC/P60 family protein, partial [Allosphingosinicella sp.]
VLEYTGSWAWGYCTADHRVGYVEAIELVDPALATHVVCEAQVPVFADSAIEATRLACMPMGSRLTGHEEGACLMSEIGCVPMSHLRRVDELESDPATVAMRLIGSKYRAGGRSHCGIDAAGLIQLALGQCGVTAPRDLDMQAGLGEPVASGARLRRGDVVIAGDEGGVMIDDLMLIHASRSAGKVTVEPVAVVEARHEDSARRRITI